MKTPAQTDQRRNGGENGAAVISGHQHVADVALTAGRTHLVASIGNVSTASEQTLLHGGTALGHRHTFPTSIHHVEGGAVFSILWAVHVRGPTVAVVVVYSILACEALESARVRCS